MFPNMAVEFTMIMHWLAKFFPEITLIEGRTGWPKWNGSLSTRLAKGRSRETSDVEREESTLDRPLAWIL